MVPYVFLEELKTREKNRSRVSYFPFKSESQISYFLIVAAATILFEFIKAWKFHIVCSPYAMKTWIVSSLDEETIQGRKAWKSYIVSSISFTYVMKNLILSSLDEETIWGNTVQVNLCQKLLFLHQLTHKMTTDCSLNYKFNTWQFQA